MQAGIWHKICKNHQADNEQEGWWFDVFVWYCFFHCFVFHGLEIDLKTFEIAPWESQRNFSEI